MPRRSQKVSPKDKDKIKEKIRSKLKVKNFQEKSNFIKLHPHAHKYFQKKGIELGKIREHSAKVISAGALTGALLLTPPSSDKKLPAPSDIIQSISKEHSTQLSSSQERFLSDLATVLPNAPRPLSHGEEKLISIMINDYLGLQAKATLEGEHLNTSYGKVGAEQHLKRYPGDTVSQHGDGEILKEGIAPGLGAWGYFAPTSSRLTPALEETEKWYAVVQTLYLPDWIRRQPYLRDWYKYRKVLIVNTNSGNAVVAAISDAGPAAWTGKHYGGSPEVMMHLGGPRYKKGPVILFFVDDPENDVPLGPVEYNKLNQIPKSMLVST